MKMSPHVHGVAQLGKPAADVSVKFGDRDAGVERFGIRREGRYPTAKATTGKGKSMERDDATGSRRMSCRSATRTRLSFGRLALAPLVAPRSLSTTQLKKYPVEFIGIFLLVLAGGLIVRQGVWPLGPLAIGLVLLVMIFAGDHVSGGRLNPAVTLAAVRRVSRCGNVRCRHRTCLSFRERVGMKSVYGRLSFDPIEARCAL
jgi:hypothetical protein